MQRYCKVVVLLMFLLALVAPVFAAEHDRPMSR